MDLRQIEYFSRVVESGSFSAAAATLDLAQPTLSRQIGLLEGEFGQRLLVRTGRGVVPTEAGRTLHGHARAILEQVERARADLHEMAASPTGRVVVGLPPRVAHVLSTALVRRFRERFPRAVISVAEGLSLHLREWLLDGRVDLALLFDPPASAQIHVETLARERLLLIGPRRGSSLPRRVGLAALGELPMVLPSSPNAIRKLLEEKLRPRQVALAVVAEVDSVQTVLRLVRDAIGFTVLPESAVPPAVPRGELQVVEIGPPAIRNRLVLATSRARPATRLARETATLLRELDFIALNRIAQSGGERAA